MVCSLGSGKMAALSRLLEAGNSLQQIAEEVSHQKLIAHYVYREFHEADEPNLLDEEDMHVFDLKPMTDPLHLVCCNTCKKPVKASQYAPHADLCKLLSSREEAYMEVDGGTGHKKPPRKERRKSLRSPAYFNTTNGALERSEAVEVGTPAASESLLGEQLGMTSSFPVEVKRDSASGDMAPKSNTLGVLGRKDRSPGVPPPAKRSKSITLGRIPLSDDLETDLDTRSNGNHETHTCRELQDGTLTGSNTPCHFEQHMTRQVHGCYLLGRDVPAPLASKMYYSQRNHRLRSAVRIMYYEALTEENSGVLASSKGLQGHMISPYLPSSTCLSHEHVDDQTNVKRHSHLSPSGQKPDQISSSEVCLGKGEEFPHVSLSNQVSPTNVLRSHAASVGISRNQYLSQPYTFAGNSGSMQQPNGSVPVI